MGFNSSGGGIAAATDVSFSSPQNKQVLGYDSTTVKWVNQTVAAAGGSSDMPDYIYVTDTTESALRAAITQALNTRSGTTVTKRIILGPGNWNIANPNLIDSPTGGTSSQVFGLEIHGMGPRVTTITFTNASGSATTDARRNNLFTAANRLRYFKLQDITITSTNSYNNMLWAWSVASITDESIYPEYGYGQNQRCQFINVEWSGSWNRVIGIDGDINANNNSEWLLRDCNTTNSAAYTDAFLHCGGITGSFTQQAQFLNFRIDNCNMTCASGNVFTFDRGGAITVTGGSWSAASSSNAIKWFNFTRSTDLTAMSLYVVGVRFEPKSGSHIIIDCAWGSGHVTFQSCSDIASLQFPKGSAQGSYKLHRYVGLNNRIPLVRYIDCTLVGQHTLAGFAGGAGKMIYEGTKLYHWNAAIATAINTDDGFLHWSSGSKPRSVFRDMDDSLADVTSP